MFFRCQENQNSNLGNFSNPNHRADYFNGDLNTITENGIVNCDPVETQNKPPVSQWFFVLTMAHSHSIDYITQVAFTMNTNPYEDSIWLRQKNAGAWGAWGKIGDAVKPSLSDRRVGYNLSFETLISSQTPTYFTNWDDSTNFPELYGSGLLIPGFDSNNKYSLYVANGKTYIGKKYGDLPFQWYAIASQADIDWLTNILNEMKNSRRIHSLWSGLVTSGTQITYNCAISSYPSAKRLIFAFRNEEMNITLSIEIPYYYWEQETNFGSFTKEDDAYFVLLKIIPSHVLTDTGCTLTWDTGTQHPFKLASILLEY